jgi:UDP-3-O-[3-hydroxymyristoyl] N-acetylglucosamine deacetylase
MNQTTLAATATMTGTSLHEGHDVTLTLSPAPADTGYVIVRADRDNARVHARVGNITEMQRRTLLVENGVEVHTVEHVLAALYGLGVDNALITLTAPEPPAGDGSSAEFMALVRQVGISDLGTPRRVFTPAAAIEIRDGDASIRAEPGEGLRVRYTLDYGVPFMPPSTVEFAVDARTFEAQIGPARTFCLEQEARALQAMGFGKGANTQNTLVVGPEGPLENSLRFDDEYARHKLLDVVGDLALAGVRLNATITATKSGHSLNQKLAKALRAEYDGA